MKAETQEDKSYRKIEENRHVSFSPIKGLKIEFQDESRAITFEVSPFSGLERVLIDNQIVSKKRTFKRQTKHHFHFNEYEYVIEFTIKSLIRFTWTCSLIRNGVLFQKFECKNIQNEQRFFKRQPEAFYGGLTGFAFAMGYISLYTVFVIVIIGSIFSFRFMKQFLLVKESLSTSS